MTASVVIYPSVIMSKTGLGKEMDRALQSTPGSDFKLFSREMSQEISGDCIGMVYRLDIDKLDKKSIDVFYKSYPEEATD